MITPTPPADPLAAARRARIENGPPKRTTPLEKLAKNPKSLRLAINGLCYDCGGQDADAGWRQRIGHCNIPTCPLYAVRPYQGVRLLAQQEDLDSEE